MSQRYRKTGASFSEVLGAARGGAVTADRLIHAIDGLRKAQDEDKTGSKGVVSALKEPPWREAVARPNWSSALEFTSRNCFMVSSGLFIMPSTCFNLFAGQFLSAIDWP